MDVHTQHTQYIGEDLQIECIARHGTVFGCERGKASGYWQNVWDWLKSQHPCVCEDLEVDYPNADGHDINVLNEIWDWQEVRYTGAKP